MKTLTAADQNYIKDTVLSVAQGKNDPTSPGYMLEEVEDTVDQVFEMLKFGGFLQLERTAAGVAADAAADLLKQVEQLRVRVESMSQEEIDRAMGRERTFTEAEVQAQIEEAEAKLVDLSPEQREQLRKMTREFFAKRDINAEA